MRFRNDISFLRALSVLIVMFFHFKIPFFEGGFIGVDVFFVISGFLMTKIVLKDIDENKFSLKEFYLKRIKRIIPPLLILLVFVLVISVVFFLPSDIRLNAKYVFLSEFFISNIYFWKYLDYFASHDNILLHTWSLGVEWQFYMIYPILILLLKKLYLRRHVVFWRIMIGITVLSFILMVVIAPIDNNFAFYMLPTRFWELSIGGLAFYLSQLFSSSKTVKQIVVYGSILAILFSVLFFSSNFLWPSWYTLIPVVATVLILMLNYNATFFDSAFVKFFGDTSYSLYLWHWPWFVFFQYFGFIEGKYTVILIVISVLSAFLSYRFIESRKSAANLKIITILFLGISVIASVLFFKADILKSLSIYKDEKFKIGDYFASYEPKIETQFNPCKCFISNDKTFSKHYNLKKCLTFDRNRRNILLMGDSHAAQFSSSLREVKDFNILEANAGFTFPFLNARGRSNTVPLMHYMYEDFIPKEHKKIDLVILSVHWLMKENAYMNYTDAEIIAGIKETVNYLNKYSLDYLIIGQSESYTLPYPRIAMLGYLGRDEKEFINEKAERLNNMIKKEIPADKFIDIYCSPFIQHIHSDAQTPYMIDSNHFSKFGADQVVKNLILPRIEEKLNRK